MPGFNEYGYVGGLRVWKKITRNGSTFEHRLYVHAGPNLIAEYNAGAAASSPAQEYVYADQIDSLVMIHRSNGQRLGVTRNRQWSVVGLHDLANGNVVERYCYDMTGKRTIYAPNGTTIRTTSSFGNHVGYTNRWHDEESGLINFRARHYNPLTGEFLRRDPAGFVDGMSLYRGYIDVNYVDPSGLQTVRCRCYSGWLDGDVFGSTTDVQVECNRVLDDCCRKACSKLGGWTGTYQAQNTQEFSNLKYEDYLFSYESKQPHDFVDLWLTWAKLGSFGIAGVSLGGAGITYGVSTFGWYGLGAIVLKEAGDTAKDAVLESTIGVSPPTGIRSGLKSIGEFIAKVLKPKPRIKHWTELAPQPKGARARRGMLNIFPDDTKVVKGGKTSESIRLRSPVSERLKAHRSAFNLEKQLKNLLQSFRMGKFERRQSVTCVRQAEM